ncbi:MAG: retroviral-like aspartic protease family protein [Pseudomonadales bacterium]|nr:retroviral-like aspartic protease family protein [Pseudomonadales bacterium]
MLNVILWIKWDQSINILNAAENQKLNVKGISRSENTNKTQTITQPVSESVLTPVSSALDKSLNTVLTTTVVDNTLSKKQTKTNGEGSQTDKKLLKQLTSLEHYQTQLNSAAKSFNWDGMLQHTKLIFDLIENLDQTQKIKHNQLVSKRWLDKLSQSKQNKNTDSWIDAMLQYIDRKPEDLKVGYFYLQYLIEKNQFEDALSYVNYLLQISTDVIASTNLTQQFNQFILDYLIALKNDNQLTSALNLLNTVLQYEVLNIPLLIQKTQVQILIGDYIGAQQTLSQFEYELDYQTQVESFKLQIQNAPKDRSIKLRNYGGQFIVNTLFDDGYQENTIPLLIDTGASTSVINEAIFLQYIDSPNVRFIKQINVDTAGGKVGAKLYEIDRIKIGEFEVLNTQFIVLPMALNKPYQGLLGMSFLRKFDFNIDQKSSTLHLE